MSDWIEKIIDDKILNLHTAFLGIVIEVNFSSAMVQPLNSCKMLGEFQTQKPIKAIIPPNIKYKTDQITYQTSNSHTETKTILVPDKLCINDLVYVGVCERDITYTKKGDEGQPTSRHHDINDAVILCVMWGEFEYERI